ncbi:hypothetical protein ACHAXN_013065 [Cyclotella atomus]
MTNPQDSEQGGRDNGALTEDEMDGWGRREPIDEDVFAVPMEIDNPNFLDQRTETVMPIDHVLPGMDGVPISELNQTYCKTDQGIKISDFYTVFDNGNLKDLLFTAIFTCPIKGEHFASGDWGESKNVVRMGDIFWFKTKKQAKSAAAARTLDVLSVRRCHGINRRPFQRCRDEPYRLNTEAPVLPDLPPGIQLPNVEANDGSWDSSPKAALNEWYQHFQKRLREMGGTLTMDSPEQKTYASWNNIVANRLFTSVFTCPMTGERFASGTLADKQYDKVPMYYDSDRKLLKFNIEFDEDEEIEPTVHKLDFIWYKTKKDAEDAAAARALDCLRFRYPASHSSANQKKYCMEEPYTTDSIPEPWDKVSDTVTQVHQFEITKNGEIIPKHALWPILPSESKIPEDVLKSVFDQDMDELLRAYKHQRTMPPVETAEEEE